MTRSTFPSRSVRRETLAPSTLHLAEVIGTSSSAMPHATEAPGFNRGEQAFRSTTPAAGSL
jgi:hypothetical protein